MGNIFHLKSFLKFLGKNQIYTFVAIFGMAVSFMIVLLNATYSEKEFNTDHFHKNQKRIYALANEKVFSIAYGVGDRLQEKFPEIEAFCQINPFYHQDNTLPITLPDRKLNARLTFADANFFEFFSFPLLTGSPDQVLSSPGAVVISERFAKRAFPDRDPIGQPVQLNDSLTVRVSGVMKDIKNSCVRYTDMIVCLENIRYFSPESYLLNYNIDSYVLFVLAGEGQDLKSREPDVTAYLKEFVVTYKVGAIDKAIFVPLTDIYFSEISGYGRLLKQGEPELAVVLFAMGVLILLFALINYINLTIAQTGFRIKEMSVRRLSGAPRFELFFRLMLESVCICFISFVIGLFLAFYFLPFANELLQVQHEVKDLFSSINLSIGFLYILLVGFLAGVIPASIISGAQPADVVKGELRYKSKILYSKYFIIFQHVCSMLLIATTITMGAQTYHLASAPLNYNVENVLDIPVRWDKEKDTEILVEELRKLPCLENLSLCAGTPFSAGSTIMVDIEDRILYLQLLYADSAYVDILGIRILQENYLPGSYGFYISKRGVEELGIDFDTPAVMVGDLRFIIAGIIDDIQLRNIDYDDRPVLLQIQPSDDFSYGVENILLQVKGDPVQAYREVKEVYERIAGIEFTGKYIQEQIWESYEYPARITRIVSVFTFIAVLLSVLGLIAISSYYIQQHAKEIAIRKVFGSTSPKVLQHLIRMFMEYVGIAFIIAVPFVYYIMNWWLSTYTYRISLSPWIFIAAGLFCALVSFVTVFWQCRLAAHTNPAESIRKE